ncbi:MAG: OmpH family outer membrane protein [Ferruginibacter sp.]
MKQLSLILNAVLFIAVIILYVKVFSGPGKAVTQSTQTSGSTRVVASEAGDARPPIAYVDLDSLNEHINYIKERRRQLESEQKNIESDWNSGMRNLESRKDNFLKKGNAITQAEAEKFQGELYQAQQQLESRKQTMMQKLSEKSYKFMDDIQKKLKTFLADYNKDKQYMYILTTGTGLDYMVYKDSALNITSDVVQGMNKKLDAK